MYALRPVRPTPASLLCLTLAAVLAGCTTAPAQSPAPPSATPPPPAASVPAAPGTPPQPATAASTATAPARSFAQWIAQFQEQARADGISEATLHAAFDGVQQLPQVVSRDRSQSEFTRAIWDYLDTAVSPQRIARGQDRLQQVRPQADAAAARFGVPAEVLVAIWGMESNYGANYGDIPTIDALATLGFDGRRGDWARSQLLAALRILQSGDIARERMVGSWAGAMGQTQFLPSNFLAYAVDADADGRRDIWGSMADVLASTANFLARVGWQRDQPWGLEVRLPAGFDLARADPTVRQTAAMWAAEGLQSMDGTPLPPALAQAEILLPAGARGPAFLVGPNFRAILRYNNASSYALAVGLLAQGIAGHPGVQAAWPRELQPLTRSQVIALQAGLNQRGFDSGTPDGLLGPATRSAVRAWQRSVGQAADGFADQVLLRSVLQGP